MTRVEAAEARSAEARLKIAATVGVLQDRLDPRSIASDVVETIADRGRKAIDTGVVVARENPGKLAAMIGLVALFLGRRTIAGLVSSRDDDRSMPERKPVAAPRVRPPNTRSDPVKRIPK